MEMSALFLEIAGSKFPLSAEMKDFFSSLSFALCPAESERMSFDFSAETGKNSDKIRFSVNDSHCGGRLREHIENFMNKCGVYDMELFRAYCGLFRNGTQFDTGIQWGKGEKFPVIKIYHEETRDVPDFFKKENNRKKLASLFGLSADDLPSYIPDIVCTDFYPGERPKNGKCDLKTYLMLRQSPSTLPGGFKFPAHNSEMPCFYFEMDGVLSGRKKYYMAYPTVTMKNPVPDIFALCRIMAGMNEYSSIKTMQDWIKTAAKYGCWPVPTLCSISGTGVFSVYCRFTSKKRTFP